MSGLTCPNCKKPAMSCIKKIIMSPAMGFKCRNCGKVMAVDMKQVLLIVFVSMVFVYVVYFIFTLKILTAVTLGIILMAIVYCKFIPLIEAEQNYKNFE